MSEIGSLLDPGVLNKFSNLELIARQVVEGFLSGRHKSPYKGFSVEFAEHREYTRGDEIRHIDWRTFGKTDRYYIKEYEVETNLRSQIVLDVSGSMAYGKTRSGGQVGVSKFTYGSYLAAALGYMLLHQQDSVGLVTFDTKIRRYIPTRSAPNHLRNICRELQQTETGGETELADVFHDLAERFKRGGMVVIISDLFFDPKSLLSALQHFRHRHHEVLLFQVLDPDELTFPFRNWSEFRDLEIDDDRIRIDPVRVREGYLESMREFLDDLKHGCGQMSIDHVMLDTTTPFDRALSYYLARRAWRK